MKSIFIKKTFLIGLSLLIGLGATLGVCAGFAAKKASTDNGAMPTIIIDAGHGGIDNGVRGIATNCDEADVNLAVARHLKGQFANAGFNAVMTRTSEAGLYGTTAKGFKARDMKKRKKIIEDNNADMVISIHQNFCPIPSKRGGTVFYDEGSEQSKLLAQKIQAELNALPECTKPNEILRGDYYMLKCTQSPSVIVECGFLSNADEDKLLNTESYQRKLSYAIFKGAINYFAG